ncbi:MAG: ABC transporter permease [Candidatus Aminicenantaceae bacterium]
MIIPKLALRNLLGAGLRTWLNVVVLSLSFVAIIWTQGVYRGMGDQASQAMIEAELGGGQYWQPDYDPLDPLTLQDAHGLIPDALQQMIGQGKATPILITQATIYPNGRMISIWMKGVDPDQNIISLPSYFLKADSDEIPALIGSRMAKSTGLKVGDRVTVRWRDAQGTFDARDVTIAQVMRTNVQTIDQGQIWIPIKNMQELTLMENEASLAVISKDAVGDRNIAGWEFKDLGFLLQDVKALVQSKSIGASILYVVLIALAMLAIFNTQVLSIFRRKKEMGTLMALGLTRFQVIKLFTLEGALHGILAAIVAAIYGLPLLIWFSKTGWAMPGPVDSYGFALGEKLFPTYSAGLVLGTTILVLVITTIVSFLPTRKIAKLKPTEALRGRIS